MEATIDNNIVLSEFITAEFYIKPIRGELAEILLNLMTGDKLFITRCLDTNLVPRIVKKNTSLFSYNFEDETASEEKTKYYQFEINSSFEYDNSHITRKDDNFISDVDGLLILCQEKPLIIPVSLDGSCDIKVSEDSMSVNADIYPSVGANSITTYKDIETKIKKIGVSSKIKEVLLKEKLYEVENRKKTFLDLCIVEGKAPIKGIDGRIENRTNKKEKIENFTSDDFYRINPVISVKENDIIAVVHPPTEGEFGSDVFGNPIAPKPGKKCAVSLGINTIYSEENRNNIVAKKDGFLNYFDSSISISDTYTVRGNIDFESGNIFAKGSLKVLGNVQNDFSLKLSQKVDVTGYVGDASIEAGDKIIIRGGFLGKGKGVIKAQNDIEVKFIENQRVYTRGSLHLKWNTLNAKLFVKDKILGKNKKSEIIGGHAIAGEFIEVNSVGNDTGTETILEVGYDYSKKDTIAERKEKQRLLYQQLEEIDKIIFELAKMKRRNSAAQEKLIELANLHKEIEVQIEELKERNLKTTSEIFIPTSAKISVHGIIYPGVKVGINGRFLSINHMMKSKTFILSENYEVIAV